MKTCHIMHWAVCRPWKDRPSCQSPLWGALRLPFGQFSVVAALVVLAHVWAAQGRHDQRVYPAHPAQEVVFTSGNASATSLSGSPASEHVSNERWMLQIQAQRERERDDKVLLPAHVKPLKYNITIQPNLDTFLFNGTEVIELLILEPTQTVLMHAADLNITDVSVVEPGHPARQAEEIVYKGETVLIKFSRSLSAGSARLSLKFAGTLNDQLNGFYRSSYSFEGQKKYLAITQFQPTDARKAFPCWDEPAVKARFEIALLVPEQFTALSNMPVKATTTIAHGLKLVEFAESPVMSTYLVALAVGLFDSVQDVTARGTEIRVFTPLGKQESGRFSLDVAKRTLSYFEDYFDIAYPLPKLDLIAVPDFAAGAMENWGCSIFREALLLADNTSSLAIKQFVAYVVGHELAHQWFGNLVSPAWWDYLWLNEGFATWVGYLAVDQLFPEWEIWTKFITDYTTTSLALDSLASSHPVEVHVKEAGDIREIFDNISYGKGASIIRMIASFLGEETFRSSLTTYLNRHTYNNTVTEDLWKALMESSGKNVTILMDTWVKATGYPVICIDHERVGQEAFLTVRQERFLSLRSSSGNLSDEANPVWWIPLSLVTSANMSAVSKYSLWEGGHGRRTEHVPLPADLAQLDPHKWIKANVRHTGFFRVHYSDPLLHALRSPLLSLTLPSSDRLLDDAFALCKAGYMRTSQLLAFLQYYANEEDFYVWTALTTNLEDLRSSWRQHLSMLQADEEYSLIRTYIRRLYRPIIDALGWHPTGPGEDKKQMLLRSLVLSYGGTYGVMEDVIKEAQKMFDQDRISRNSNIHPDLLGLVYNMAVMFGGEEEWNAMRDIYSNPRSEEQKIRAIYALGKAQSVTLIRKTLELAISNEMRSQDVYMVFAAVGANDAGVDVIWQFLKDNWNAIEKKFGSQFMILGRIIDASTAYFATQDQVKELEDFFKDKRTPNIERKIDQTIERSRSKAAWMARDGADALDWLRLHDKLVL